MGSSVFVRRFLSIAIFAGVVAGGRTPAFGQDVPAMLSTLISNESAAYQRKPLYLYTSEERSERTGGHLWREKVAETTYGKVKYLVAEDGKPLSAERAAAERARLSEIAAHPEAFRKREQALRNDEGHAKDMLVLLPKAFIFDAPQPEGEYLRIFFRPNPAYVPQSMEERVLHGMNGSILVEPKTVRLRAIEGKMPADVSIGYGLIATVKAGSTFSTNREHIDTEEWKTQTIDTDIEGRAIFFKTIARKEHSVHGDFHRASATLTPGQAVELLER
jgi:hypothetical protein